MRQQTRASKEPAEKVVQDIRRATRKHYSAEEKIRIVLEGLRGEDSIAELCRREGIAQNLYYRWSKDFLEAGKKRLAGDTARAATSDEVKDLRRETSALKEVVAELPLENRLLKKKRDGGWGGRHMTGSEKLEIIRLVEESALPVRRTLEKVGIPRHLLPLVRSVPGRWAGSPGRPTSQTRCGSSARPFAPNLTSVGRAIHQEISS
jgi:putative transposase